MSYVQAIDDAIPRPARLALVIADAGMRSRVTVALVLAGVDVLIAASLDDVPEGISVVTDRPPHTHGTAPGGRSGGPLYIVALARDRGGGVRDIVRAAHDVLAGGGSLGDGSLQQPGIERDP